MQPVLSEAAKREPSPVQQREDSEAERLQEGQLYKVVSGELRQIVLDEDDQALRKFRVPEEAWQAVKEVQKRVRKLSNRRKPDIDLVAEALLVYAAQQEQIEEFVKEYVAKAFGGK
jgi:hypothetical protein